MPAASTMPSAGTRVIARKQGSALPSSTRCPVIITGLRPSRSLSTPPASAPSNAKPAVHIVSDKGQTWRDAERIHRRRCAR